MHKLLESACEEMEKLEKKAMKSELSMQDFQLLDLLAHTKKNLLKCQKMEEGMEEEASFRGGSYRGAYGRGSYGRGSYSMAYDDGSYARGRGRGAARDSMGRYASEAGYSRSEDSDRGHDMMIQRLQEIMHDTPDERTRRKLDELVSESYR